MTAQTTINFTTALVAKQMAAVLQQLSSFTKNAPLVFISNSINGHKMATKIVVIGAIRGQLRNAFTKLSKLHAKNTFDFCIAVGDLFDGESDELNELLAGKLLPAIPIYFTVGQNAFPQSVVDRLSKDEDLCENLHYLGKRSTTKTSEGVRIVALGGALDSSIIGGVSKEQYLPFHTLDDAKSLRGASSADIFLTSLWPSNIRKGSSVPSSDVGEEPKGADHVAELIATLKPRYVFASTPDFYWEREPFFHMPDENDPEYRPVTRYISLAGHNNAHKQKAISAFNLRLPVDVTAPLPIGATASPFLSLNPNSEERKRRALEAEPYNRFATDNGIHQHRQKRGRRERQPPPGPETCFFCLANTNLAKHLICSIGEDAYVALAKGPLPTGDNWTKYDKDIAFPCHILITPMDHVATLLMIEEEKRARTYSEMNLYKTKLNEMISSRSDNRLGSVCYEISRNNGVHTHWQFLPVPTDMVSKGVVEAAFKVEAENMKYPVFTSRDPGLGENEGDFFRVWIWAPASESKANESKASGEEAGAKEVNKCITMPFDETIRFDLQFGRKVLAKLLGLEKRMQWRECEQTVDEEVKDADAFKAAFKMYDFTQE